MSTPLAPYLDNQYVTPVLPTLVHVTSELSEVVLPDFLPLCSSYYSRPTGGSGATDSRQEVGVFVPRVSSPVGVSTRVFRTLPGPCRTRSVLRECLTTPT